MITAAAVAAKISLLLEPVGNFASPAHRSNLSEPIESDSLVVGNAKRAVDAEGLLF